MYLWLSGRHDKAREYVDRMLKVAPGDKEVRMKSTVFLDELSCILITMFSQLLPPQINYCSHGNR